MRETMLRAGLEGIVLGGTLRADGVGAGRAPIKHVEDFAGIAGTDWSPVCVQRGYGVNRSGGDIAGRCDPATDPLFHRQVPRLYVTANIVIVVDGEDSRS